MMSARVQLKGWCAGLSQLVVNPVPGPGPSRTRLDPRYALGLM